MTQLTKDVRDILKRGRCEGFTYFLPAGRLEPRLYKAVNNVLTNAGGKWNKKAQAHLFNCDPAETLGLVFKTGISRNRDRDQRKMKPETFNKLHSLRMENDAAGYAMQEMKPRFDRMAGRHENGSAPRAVAVYQLFQTPRELAKRLAGLLLLKPDARILEPSAGLGRILDALALYWPARELVAVEMCPTLTAELYRQDRPRLTIKQRDFLTCTPAELGLFDAVAMNPPFHMRSDIAHVRHALNFLRPGGRLAGICMNGPHRERELRPLASSWEVLSADTFKETGTRVETVLFTIEK